MTDNQFFGLNLLGELRRMARCGMVHGCGKIRFRVGVGGLMIEQVHPIERLGGRDNQLGIRAIGIAKAIRLEEETVTRHLVFQRKRLHGKMSVLIEGSRVLAFNGMEHQPVGGVGGIELELTVEHPFELGGGIHMKVGGASFEGVGDKDTCQAQAMVGVQVTDKYMVKFRLMKVVALELVVCALAAIDHEEVPVVVDNLRGAIMPFGGQGTAATQDGNVEGIHNGNFWQRYEF